MSRVFLIALFYIACIVPFTAKAQDRGKISMFGGFSFATSGLDSSPGGSLSIAGNVTKHLDLPT